MAAKQREGRGMNADDLAPERGQIKVSLDDFRLAPAFFNFAGSKDLLPLLRNGALGVAG